MYDQRFIHRRACRRCRRNFTDLIASSPQVNGASVAGQNNRYNNIQIDGGVNNDLFGLGLHRHAGRSGERAADFARGAQGIPGPHRAVRRAPGRLYRRPRQRRSPSRAPTSSTARCSASARTRTLTGTTVDRGPLGTDVLNNFHEYQYGGSLERADHPEQAAVLRRGRPQEPGVAVQWLPARRLTSIDQGAFGVTQARPTVSRPGPRPISAIPARPGRSTTTRPITTSSSS